MSIQNEEYKLKPQNISLDQVEKYANDYRDSALKNQKSELQNLTDMEEEDKHKYFTSLAKNAINSSLATETINKTLLELPKTKIPSEGNRKIEVNYNANISESGELIVNNGFHVSINIRDADSDTRKIFTLFHEVGHYLLHVITDPIAMISERVGETRAGVGLIESEANRFSANFLVDIDRLVQQLKEGAKASPEFFIFSPTRIQYQADVLASFFGVSIEVIKYQIKNHLSTILDKLNTEKIN